MTQKPKSFSIKLACSQVQERAPIFGITLEEPASVPESVELAHDVAIPCPEEQKIQEISLKHNLDRNDPKVSKVLNLIRTMRLENPTSQFRDALTDNHVQNILHGRWDAYPKLKLVEAKP